MPAVVRHYCRAVSRHRCLQYHIILGILQMRPPKIKDFLKVRFRAKIIEKNSDIRQAQFGRASPGQSVLVLDQKRYRQHEFKSTSADLRNDAERRPAPAPHGGDHNIGVEHDSQTAHNGIIGDTTPPSKPLARRGEKGVPTKGTWNM